MEPLFIPVLEGTTRPGRKSIYVAKLIVKLGGDFNNVETVLVDPKDFNFPLDGNDEPEKDPKYTEITKKADGFFIVVPEYNHSFPGSLKRMLDSELKNYTHKPVAFAGVSASPFGGARGVESLVAPVREMGMIATFADVNFSRIKNVFDEEGNLLDDAFNARVKKSWEELFWMATVMKLGRENVPSQYHEVFS